MGWGIRIIIFTVAFVIGVVTAGLINPAVLAPSESLGIAELSEASGASLLVSCIDGNPTVEEAKGASGAVQVKCAKSEMRVVRSRPVLVPKDQSNVLSVPSGPIAASLSLWHPSTTH